jgi:hypothetical protein
MTMARSGKDGWTEEDLATLRREFRSGTPIRDIANRLGRTEKGVVRCAERLFIKRPPARVRNIADPNTPLILDMWAAGIPVEVIATETGISPNAVRIRAGNHKAKRPAWYLSAIRGKANPQGVQA